MPDSQGVFRGLDADVCRAVAAATLARNTTWTYTRSAQLGLEFTAVDYYDGQGFMVSKSATVAQSGLQDYFSRNGLKFEAVTFETADAMEDAFVAGRCDAMMSDATQLVAIRSTIQHPAEHTLLPEIVTKEPLAPVVRSGDERWANVVRWSIWVMVSAEELGLTSANITEQATTSTDPNVQRLTGHAGDLGKMLTLDIAWAAHIVAHVGNYGRAFSATSDHLGSSVATTAYGGTAA